MKLVSRGLNGGKENAYNHIFRIYSHCACSLLGQAPQHSTRKVKTMKNEDTFVCPDCSELMRHVPWNSLSLSSKTLSTRNLSISTAATWVGLIKLRQHLAQHDLQMFAYQFQLLAWTMQPQPHLRSLNNDKALRRLPILHGLPRGWQGGGEAWVRAREREEI